MIYDGLEKIGRYRGYARGLDILIDWLADHNPADLPVGSNEIDGKRVYANVMESSTKNIEDGRFEFHKKYIDVQMDLEGREFIRTTPGETVISVEYDEEKEAGFSHEAPENQDFLDVVMGKGRFVVLVPGEPHMCNLVLPGDEVGPIKKICFKLLADEFWDEA